MTLRPPSHHAAVIRQCAQIASHLARLRRLQKAASAAEREAEAKRQAEGD